MKVLVFLSSKSVEIYEKSMQQKEKQEQCDEEEDGIIVEDEEFDGFTDKVNDPAITNAKQSNIVKEIKFVQEKFKKVGIISQLTEFILKSEKKNPTLASLSFFDLLLNLSK